MAGHDFQKDQVLDGRYEILGVLGSGGMGRVYKARQLNLDRVVAIKVPSEAVLHNEEFLARFIREGQTCAQVSDDHIVQIYDVHTGEHPYLVMEYVDGMPLNQFLRDQHTTLFVSDLLDIIGNVCQGLAAAHARGIIHRDIKPGNIAITRETHRVKVMDFGIARVSDQTSLTTAGSMMGTPYYMAPEQIRGEEVSPATDLYALACVVYHLFTGRLVFEGDVATLIYKHISDEPKPPCEINPMLPPAANTVILRGLQKNPEDRYASTLEFHRELRKALRSISHLPYSQIFTPPLPSAPPSQQPTAALTSEANKSSRRTMTARATPVRPESASAAVTIPPNTQAPTRSEKPATPPSSSPTPTPVTPKTPESKPGPDISAEGLEPVSSAPRQDQRQETPPRRGPLAIWGVGVAISLPLLLIGVTVFYLTRQPPTTPGPAPTAEAPLPEVQAVAPVSEAPAIIEIAEPTQTPVEPGVVQMPGRMIWLGEIPSHFQFAEEFLNLWWSASGRESGFLVILRDLQAERNVIERRTRQQKMVFRLPAPGVYMLEVRSLGGEGGEQSLSTRIRIFPPLLRDNPELLRKQIEEFRAQHLNPAEEELSRP
ncbi:protein kinase [bacterium]|nr:protein kinase [bacterium]